MLTAINRENLLIEFTDEGGRVGMFDMPFFIDNEYNPEALVKARVVAVPDMFESDVQYTQVMDRIPSTARIERKPWGKYGECSFVNTFDLGLKPGDDIHLILTMKSALLESYADGNPVYSVHNKFILWKDSASNAVPIMDGVMVKRVEREEDYGIIRYMDGPFKPHVGEVVCVGIPRTGFKFNVNPGDVVYFRNVSGQKHEMPGHGAVEYVPFSTLISKA